MCSALYAELTLTYAQPLLTFSLSIFYPPSLLHLLGTRLAARRKLQDEAELSN